MFNASYPRFRKPKIHVVPLVNVPWVTGKLRPNRKRREEGILRKPESEAKTRRVGSQPNLRNLFSHMNIEQQMSLNTPLCSPTLYNPRRRNRELAKDPNLPHETKRPIIDSTRFAIKACPAMRHGDLATSVLSLLVTDGRKLLGRDDGAASPHRGLSGQRIWTVMRKKARMIKGRTHRTVKEASLIALAMGNKRLEKENEMDAGYNHTVSTQNAAPVGVSVYGALYEDNQGHCTKSADPILASTLGTKHLPHRVSQRQETTVCPTCCRSASALRFWYTNSCQEGWWAASCRQSFPERVQCLKIMSGSKILKVHTASSERTIQEEYVAYHGGAGGRRVEAEQMVVVERKEVFFCQPLVCSNASHPEEAVLRSKNVR
ncbi:hypothetical protein B0H16DRAFT_1696445 [Mycena metata]|uniref:Uncharacterized protein n=1 Tax=Mycena metata TaxID=1033252 RepID=A0AAD7HZX7_9AGAR|nr:hypothetical protein B0H16DRAFT_1696445 [Mycena metata]